MAVEREAIPAEVLDSPVLGVNLMPGSLRDQVGSLPALLVFLRHFGCIFCRQMVSELRRASEQSPGFPPVLFFFQDSPTEGRVFLSRYWPGARAVADRERRFYEAFDVTRGTLLQLFGPSIWSSGRRARAQGHRQGRAGSDPWMMPGIFWVEDGAIVWRHRFRHAGDQPDFPQIPELAAGAP